jgi:hypothetical protein
VGYVLSPLTGHPHAIRQQGVIGPLARCAQDLELARRVIAPHNPVPDGEARHRKT